MPAPVISLDQIMSERAFSASVSKSGKDVLTKIAKAPASWNAETRSVRFVMTAEVVDRYGDIVVSKGGDTAEFMTNPVALWAHDSRNFPIGLWSDLKTISGTPKRMEGTVTLSDEGTTPEADTAYKLIDQGLLRACSIGFIPKAWESIKDDKDRWTGYKFVEWELLECSVCSIPANPKAIAKAAGADSGLAMQAIELVLDEWARTPDGLIVPRSEYERAYEVLKDKKITLHEVKAIEEDKAPPVSINPLDISAAVSKGISDALSGDGIMAKLRDIFGLVDKKVETKPEAVKEIGDLTVSLTADPIVAAEEDGETEEQFQARMVAAKAAEDELADEAEEAALRKRAASIAA